MQQAGRRRAQLLRERHAAQGSQAASVVRLITACCNTHNNEERGENLALSFLWLTFFSTVGVSLTCDPNRPEAQAVAITAGKILAVGTERELRAFVSPKTQTIPCAGRTVLPGFIDPHLHLFAWASHYCGADLSTARSIDEIRSQLRARLATLGSQDWLRGYGYDEFFLEEKRHPNRHDLDAISTDKPVILRHRTGHAAVLNSAALRQIGIHAQFVPPKGGNVERDASGEPTGVVYELESFLRTAMPPLPAQEFQVGLRQVNSELLRNGVCAFSRCQRR